MTTSACSDTNLEGESSSSAAAAAFVGDDEEHNQHHQQDQVVHGEEINRPLTLTMPLLMNKIKKNDNNTKLIRKKNKKIVRSLDEVLSFAESKQYLNFHPTDLSLDKNNSIFDSVEKVETENVTTTLLGLTEEELIKRIENELEYLSKMEVTNTNPKRTYYRLSKCYERNISKNYGI
ncbi:unnamed protein product [Rhizophagus irregularis]|nr:unnamed protein product [Rhizophagus irregularis]